MEEDQKLSEKPKRKIPDEYDALILKLTAKMKKEVGKEIAALLLVGSVARGNYIKGDSDCDFFLVIKKNREKQVEILQKIGSIKAEFENDPQFSTLLDLTVFFEEDLTEEGINASSIVNWIHVFVGQQGVLKIGNENPFNKLKITEEKIKMGAKQMALDYVFIMRDGFLNTPPGNEQELAFYGSDAILGCAQALLFFEGEKGFTRYTVPELFAEKIKIGIDPRVLIDARNVRLGAHIEDAAGFTEQSYDSGWAIVEYMLKQ